jgi:hypothetical protein
MFPTLQQRGLVCAEVCAEHRLIRQAHLVYITVHVARAEAHLRVCSTPMDLCSIVGFEELNSQQRSEQGGEHMRELPESTSCRTDARCNNQSELEPHHPPGEPEAVRQEVFERWCLHSEPIVALRHKERLKIVDDAYVSVVQGDMQQ